MGRNYKIQIIFFYILLNICSCKNNSKSDDYFEYTLEDPKIENIVGLYYADNEFVNFYGINSKDTILIELKKDGTFFAKNYPYFVNKTSVLNKKNENGKWKVDANSISNIQTKTLVLSFNSIHKSSNTFFNNFHLKYNKNKKKYIFEIFNGHNYYYFDKK